MNKKQLWITFLAGFALIAFWFSLQSGYQIYRWMTQSAKSSPTSINWKIEKKAEGRFILIADYTFSLNGKEINGRTAFPSMAYKNIQTAEYFLSKQMKTPVTIRYSSSQPKNSTINRFFPLKSCIYTAIVWSILFYFIWLGYYTARVSKFGILALKKAS